ncbi:hypothetical protein RIF29_00399 [Crotalaria pallida]|uniref:Uncharacterized protein n=1 Tax=Crotalaria pallida TaxID=3830 RepID=A0AAN9P771_CROPI
MELWLRFGFSSPDFFIHDVHQWIKKMLADVAPLKFLVVLWWSWRWRNALILDSVDWNLDYICFKINMLLADMAAVFNLDNNPTRSMRVLAWCRPPPSSVKLNVDGSYRSGESCGSSNQCPERILHQFHHLPLNAYHGKQFLAYCPMQFHSIETWSALDAENLFWLVQTVAGEREPQPGYLHVYVLDVLFKIAVRES